ADPGAQFDHVDTLVVDVLAVERDPAADAAAVDGVVHAVEAAQECRFAAAGRADQRGDAVALDLEVHVEERLLGAVEDVDVLAGHGDALLGRLCGRRDGLRPGYFQYAHSIFHFSTTDAPAAAAGRWQCRS